MKIPILAVTVVLAAAPVGRAQVKDLAELFPAKTRVYLEINGIADVVKEVRGLVKGSCLEDVPKSMEKFAGLMRNDFFFLEFLQYGMMLSPEALSEFSRFRGGAIAFTDLTSDPDKSPEVVGVLLPGQSNIPGLYLRLFMSIPMMKKVAEVEGVGLYRYNNDRETIFRLEGKKIDQPPAPGRESGPTIAMVPGAIVMGSSKDVVGDVIRRLKGKGKGPTLAGAAEFKKTAELRSQPGLFAHADGEALVNLCIMTVNSLKNRTSVYPLEKLDPKFEDKKELPKLETKVEIIQVKKETGVPALVREIMDIAKGFRSISLNFTVKDGSAQVNGTVTLDSKAKSPWPDFFSARTLDVDLLRYMPKNSRLGIFAALPEGTAFWDKLGKAAPLLETELSLALGKTLLKIARVGLIDAGGHEPVILVEATEAASAPDLAETLGKILKKQAQTKGRLVALAADRKLAAAVLAGKGLGTAEKMLDALKEHQQAHLLLAWSVGQTLAKAIRDDAKNQNDPKLFEKKFKPEPKIEDKKAVLLQEALGEKKSDDKGPPPLEPSKMLLKLAGRAAAALEPLPPFVLSLSKKSEHLILKGRQSQLQTFVPRLIDILVEWELTSPRNRFYAW